MADGDNIDSYVERWCEKVHKADGVIQYDISLPAQFAPDCNPVSLILYLLVGIIFTVLAGLLISHYYRRLVGEKVQNKTNQSYKSSSLKKFKFKKSLN